MCSLFGGHSFNQSLEEMSTVSFLLKYKVMLTLALVHLITVFVITFLDITMPPKKQSAGYNADENPENQVPEEIDEDVQELIQMLEAEEFFGNIPASSNDDLNGMMERLNQHIETTKNAQNLLKSEIGKRAVEKKKKKRDAEAKAKATSDAAKAKTKAKRQGDIVVVVVLPSGRRLRVRINKSLTVGRLREAIIQSGHFGKARKLSDISIVINGIDIGANPRKDICNCEELLVANPTCSAMTLANFNAGPVANQPQEDAIPNDEEEIDANEVQDADHFGNVALSSSATFLGKT